MGSFLNDAHFGQMFKTRSGRNAVFIRHLSILKVLKVEGIAEDMLFHPDGRYSRISNNDSIFDIMPNA